MRSLECRTSSPLDFDRVIAAISEQYPGTRVVEADWYAERRERDAAACKRVGIPVPNPVIESLDRVWAERGLQLGFEVPVRDGLTLYARLDRTGGYLFCRDREFDEQDVSPLIEILRRFGLLVRFDFKRE